MRKWIRRKNWTLARDFYLNELQSTSTDGLTLERNGLLIGRDGLALERSSLSDNTWLDFEVFTGWLSLVKLYEILTQ